MLGHRAVRIEPQRRGQSAHLRSRGRRLGDTRLMGRAQPEPTSAPRAIAWRLRRTRRSARQLRLITALFTVALGAAGCGGSASASSQIRGTLQAAAEGLVHGNGQQVCNTLTQSAIDTLVSADSGSGNEDCAQIIDTAAGDLAANTKAMLRNLHFTYLHISGDHATGEDSTGGTPDHFTKVGGHWYFSSSSFG
jgi:hypothetical protein